MTSQALTQHPDDPTHYVLFFALLALPQEQLQHLEAALALAWTVGNLIRMHCGER
ncbi:hypothetical protein [Streptomyces sp. Ac-502]|uniref:hypothetical protein n=1 Tax=Streptomyces sp. Ac-502 TaxID=3342801 RepID=UPI003862ADAB